MLLSAIIKMKTSNVAGVKITDKTDFYRIKIITSEMSFVLSFMSQKHI